MSEYQYYEFAALDQPLSAAQQDELRNMSSRASISAGGFCNEYHWGDLKGEPKDWMRRYFDAHVYSANWGSCRLLLRLPLEALDKATLAPYVAAKGAVSQSAFVDAFEATRSKEHWILDWQFNDDSGDYERFFSQEDGPGWMARLAPLRRELMAGDTRPLYIGWLARLGNEELDEDDLEPAPPPGLNNLSVAQQALVEFLMIDPDWLAAAAVASAPMAAAGEEAGLADWLKTLDADAMRAALGWLMAGRGMEAERSLRQRFLASRSGHGPAAAAGVAQRTVAQLEVARGEAEVARVRREQEAAAVAMAQRQKQRAAALDALVGNADAAWQTVDIDLQRGTGAANEQAQRGVLALAEAFTHAGREAEFRAALVRLMAAHGHRKAWVARLTKAGLLW
jgi:hypothetical protein